MELKKFIKIKCVDQNLRKKFDPQYKSLPPNALIRIAEWKSLRSDSKNLEDCNSDSQIKTIS